MAKHKRGPTGLRPGSRRLELATDGLILFLSDDAHRKRILELGGAGLVYQARSAAIEEAVSRIEREGLLVAFELFGDGRVVLDLAVGDPLSKAEERGAKWLPPQTASSRFPRESSASMLPSPLRFRRTSHRKASGGS
jgi:hypothetical protein